jgi:hypothetical protein
MMADMDPKYTLSAKEAADRLGIGASRLRQLRLEGRIVAIQHGRDWWYAPADIDGFRRAKPRELTMEKAKANLRSKGPAKKKKPRRTAG